MSSITNDNNVAKGQKLTNSQLKAAEGDIATDDLDEGDDESPEHAVRGEQEPETSNSDGWNKPGL